MTILLTVLITFIVIIYIVIGFVISLFTNVYNSLMRPRKIFLIESVCGIIWPIVLILERYGKLEGFLDWLDLIEQKITNFGIKYLKW